jgi:hypothetical protein
MATYYVSSLEDPVSSSGNAGTLADPMGLQEAMTAAVAGDEIRVMDDGDYIFAGERTPGTPTASEASPILMTGANASGIVDGSCPYIENTTGNDEFIAASIQWWLFEHLRVKCYNRITFSSAVNCRFFDVSVYGTGVSSRFASGSGSQFISCTFDGTGIFYASNFSQSRTFIDCLAVNATSFVAPSSNGRRGDHHIGCVALNCSSHGFHLRAGGDEGISFAGCLALSCGGSGFLFDSTGNSGNTIASGCIAIDCAGDGFTIPSSSNNQMVTLADCVSVLCGGYGFFHGDSVNVNKVIRRCYGHGNTSGLESGGWLGAAVALGADPFVDSLAGDILLASNSAADILKAVSASAGNGMVSSRFPFRALVGVLGGGGGGTRAWFG